MKKVTITMAVLMVVNFLSFGQFAEIPEKIDNSQNIVNLNGKWFFNPVFNSSNSGIKKVTNSWKEIEVPGEWLMQGFEVEPGEQAGYFREFDVPDDWKNNTIYLKCDAVFSHTELWLNGKEAGTHTGPMVAFEKDVTSLVKFGKTNRIAMGATSETMADTLMSGTQYAAHQLGGILRKIYLYAVPKVHLADLAVVTSFDEKFENATLKINGLLLNKNKLETSSLLAVSLTDPLGNNVPLKNNQSNIQFNGDEFKEIALNFEVKNPMKWDAEHPHLYKLELLVKSGKDTEKIVKKVGFRQIAVVGNQLFVNGLPVKLKGVNRHEVHPLRGRSLTPELCKRDAELFKNGNVNYIRTSHYPPSEEFVEWCDELGLYVELENPLSWVGHHANQHWINNEPHNPEFYPYLEKISEANISFYRNHPSVLIWSMVNESAWGPNWAKLAKFFATKDPTRPATFHDQAYGGFNNYGSTAMPVANIHYPGTGGPAVAEDFTRPLLFGEFAHLNTYNRTEIVTDPGVRDSWGRGFKKMWEGMYKSRGCLGGAIWSGIDDVFYLPEGRSVGYGEWGPIDGWRREKPEYFHMKKSYSPVKIHTQSVLVPEAGKGINLQIENRFDFTNLSECKINWQLENKSGMVNMDLAPHQYGVLTIHPKSKNIDGKLLNVTITSPQGLEVEACVIEIGNVKRDDFPFIKTEAEKLQVSEQNKILNISGANFSWEFDLAKGKLKSAETGGNQTLVAGAELMILSLTTGECLTEHDLNIPFHNSTCTNWSAESTNWTETNDTVNVSVKGAYTEAEGTIIYQFTNDGAMKVSYQMTSKIKVNPRQWGMVFTTPKEVKNLDWYRKGLWSYYPENHIGRTLGSAVPFDKKAFYLESFGQQPENAWKFDANKMGTNDFRSTRENIYWAALSNDQGTGLTVISNGKQAFRSFVDGENISFLVADYSTGGGDLFFSGHYRNERKSLEEGTKIEGSVKIQMVKAKK